MKKRLNNLESKEVCWCDNALETRGNNTLFRSSICAPDLLWHTFEVHTYIHTCMRAYVHVRSEYAYVEEKFLSVCLHALHA